MIKVLGLALYGPLAASTRYRLCQYVPGLAAKGIDLQIRSLLSDEYLRARFNGHALPIIKMLKDGFARVGDLCKQYEYDAVIIHCELIPMMPGWLEKALVNKPYIYDFDDAFYLKYRSGSLRFASPLLGSKFDTVIAGAAAVTAGNHILANYARMHNSKTRYLPTVVDTERYIPFHDQQRNKIFTIGWIGSPSTAPYLSELVEPLSAIGLEGSVRFIVIGGKAPTIPNVSVDEFTWDENTELELINLFDVGVMPIPNNEWTRGKCAFKLIQYMACAVPVVGSPVGANLDVVDAECGLFATTAKEWEEAFRFLRCEPTIRKEMGKSGRNKVLKNYSLKNNLDIMVTEIINITKNIN